MRSCALDNPAVAAELLAGLDASARDARFYPAPVTRLSAATVVISFVSMELVRPAARSATFARDGRDGVDQLFEGHAVVGIGAGQQKRERVSAAVSD
jgi:hypothetical protein